MTPSNPMTPHPAHEPMTLRRHVLHTYRNGGYIEVIPIRLYGPTPIDTSGYVGHRTHEQLERFAKPAHERARADRKGEQ